MHRVATAKTQPSVPWAEPPANPADFLSRLEQLEKKEMTTTSLWGDALPAAAPAFAPPRRAVRPSSTSMNADDALNDLKNLQDEIDRARARRSTPPEKRVGEGL